MSQQELYSPQQAPVRLAELGVETTTGTLGKWRSEGAGPRFHKVGRNVRYSEKALQDYARQRIGREFSSTSEARAARASA